MFFQIAAEIAAPLGKTKEIVILNQDSASGVGSEVTKLIGTLPPAVKALSGVDLTKVNMHSETFVLEILYLIIL